MNDQLLDIPASDYRFQAIRSSGPGGQHVNKVASAIQIQYSISESSLSDEQKERLIKLSDNRISSEGVITITAKRYRSQHRNKEDAILRLRKLVTKGIQKPKRRKKTQPTKASQEKRLQDKSRKSEIKTLRKKIEY